MREREDTIKVMLCCFKKILLFYNNNNSYNNISVVVQFVVSLQLSDAKKSIQNPKYFLNTKICKINAFSVNI